MEAERTKQRMLAAGSMNDWNPFSYVKRFPALAGDVFLFLWDAVPFA